MVKIIEIENLDEWLKYRGTGIGASEVSSIINMNSYKSALELFYDKVGFKPHKFYSLRALYGKQTEALTSSLFECYNGKETHAKDVTEGRKVRSCEKYPEYAFVLNTDIPNIYVSPDRKFTSKTGSGVLEIKDSKSMVLNAWENRIVPSHVIQLRCQMMVAEISEGYLAYNIDAGSDYEEHHFVRNGIIWEDGDNKITETNLKQKVFDFWEAVVLARDASHKMMVARMNYQNDKADAYEAVIAECEPPPDTSLSYEKFLKDGWYSIARNLVEIKGTEEHEKIAEEFIKAKEIEASAKENMQLWKNKVLNLCKSGEKITLPGKGIIEVRDTKRGVSINVKV